MASSFRSPISETPTVTKNLIIINAIMLLATMVLEPRGINLTHYLALYYPQSENFHIWQLVTHMFMHANLAHLFFNMFALWMFGRVLETVWGPKRFLIFYFVTGLGAAALHTFVNYLEIHPLVDAVTAFTNTPSAELFSSFVNKYQGSLKDMGYNNLPGIVDFAQSWLENPKSPSFESDAVAFMQQFLDMRMNIPTVGASGAVYGVLLGFGMLFPNTQLMLLFPPIPIKAKWMVIAYGALELILGLSMRGSNIAHFAHLGGMIFGFFLIRYWNKTGKSFY
jgi:membrane associated rhomboid family serine protease